MDLGSAGLKVQPFPSHGKPLAVVSYDAMNAAMEVLRNTCAHRNGLSLLQGPSLSGKSTLIRHFVASSKKDCAVALINGKGLNTTQLLSTLLQEFGYNIELTSTKELLGLVRIFALQQAAADEPPLLILENAHELTPGALRALCELAELSVQYGSALKMVLVSDRSLKSIVAARGMRPIADRVLHSFHLGPMSERETRHYLYVKLRAAGNDFPEFVFPEAVCQRLWEVSGGWPGIVDRVALLALAKTDILPVTVEQLQRPALPSITSDADPGSIPVADIAPVRPPQLIVTNNGSVLNEVTLQKPRTIIGRSEHNDISIDSRFISRHHALLVYHGSSTILMDLNSTNGTFVNSKRISNQALVHNDIIVLGHHRIKFHDPGATTRDLLDGSEFADTSIMKTLDDMRKLLAEQNTLMLPDVSEDLPTIQT